MLYVKQTWLETVHKTLEVFFPGSVMLGAPILYGARYHAMCTTRDEDGWRPPKNQMVMGVSFCQNDHPDFESFWSTPVSISIPLPPLPVSRVVLVPSSTCSSIGSFATMRTDEPKWIPITIWQSHTISSFSYFCCKKCRLNCCKNVYSYLCYPKKTLTELVSSPWQPCDAPLFRGAAALSFLQRLHGNLNSVTGAGI